MQGGKCRNDVKARPFVRISLDVPAAQNRSYKFISEFAFGSVGTVGEDFGAFFSVDDEGIIEACLDSVIYGNVPVFEREANCFNLAFYALFYWVENYTSGTVRGEGNRFRVLLYKNAPLLSLANRLWQ